VEILLRQGEQLVRDSEKKNREAALKEEALRAQLADREEDFKKELKLQEDRLTTGFEQTLENMRRAESDNAKAVRRYAIVSAFCLIVAFALWVTALGKQGLSLFWLVVLLIASALAAGISGSTIQVAFSALGIGQTQPQLPQKPLPSVITNSAMGLVGGGITMFIYIITQLVAIGDDVQAKHYLRLIPFAIVTGFAAGFALDVVARKLRDLADKGVPPAFPTKT
jgi:hypothetical protein